MAIDLRALSKTISHALRHAPWQYELELDDEGWVPVDALLTALRTDRAAWAEVGVDALTAIIATATKQRFELAAGRIRALYGHSLVQRLARTPAAPPARLFHGTSPAAAAAILAEGLRPMGRQYVHMSIDVATALEVGRRKAARPVLLAIRAGDAHAAGTGFYAGNDKVWLAEAVPASYLAPA